MKTLFRGISRIYGTDSDPYKRGLAMDRVSFLERGFMLVENGKIIAIGSDNQPPEADEIFDFGGAEVLPGFVDSHTHAVFPTSREEEFVMRIKGASYEEIFEAGGGILNSAKKLQNTSEEELFLAALERVKTMIRWGTTTLEIKSGYGLTFDAECKMLRVIKRLNETLPIVIKATFLGAHAFPTEFKSRQEEYMDLLINKMIPWVAKEQLAQHVDVFCEKGFFSVEQTQRILNAARSYGLPSKIHGNQLGNSGGVEVAVAQGSWSIDHLEYSEQEQWELLSQSFNRKQDEDRTNLEVGTMPVALPGASFFLGLPYTRAREIIDFGLPLALATDFNPGSSPIHSLQMISSLACTQMHMSPEEVFNAITINAAYALRLQEECGSLSVGKRADFLVMKSNQSLAKMPYYMGENQVDRIFIKGEEWV